MALRVKAVERLLKFDKESEGKYRYVMKPELYTSLNQQKVLREAALCSCASEGVMQACCWRGDQGVGNGRPQRGAAWTGYHALRTALEGSGGRERREDGPH